MHVRMDLFLIPALVALCRRIALRCPPAYSDAGADELEALIRAVGGVFQVELHIYTCIYISIY